MGAAKPRNSLPTGQPENHSKPFLLKKDPSCKSQLVEAEPPSSQDDSTPASQAEWPFVLPTKCRPVRPSLLPPHASFPVF